MTSFQQVPPSILEAKTEHKPSSTHDRIDAFLAMIDQVLADTSEGPDDALAAG